MHGCPAGSWCQGSSACGSAWQCSSPYPTSCTAGIVGIVCNCEGKVEATDGCPTRHAYGLGSQFGRTWELLAGARCDPSRIDRPPFAMKYRVQGRGWEAFEGASVSWRFALPEAAAPLLPELAGLLGASVRAGGFAWEARPAGPVSDSRGVALHEGYNFHIFIDVDSDGICEPMLDRGGSTGPSRVDFLAMQFEYELSSAPPALADPQLCARFN